MQGIFFIRAGAMSALAMSGHRQRNSIALAVFRVMISSELGRLFDRQILRLHALENTIDIDRRLPELVVQSCPVGQQGHLPRRFPVVEKR
jgi:hypothetical protein